MIKFNYILNDIAFDTLVIKCLYGEPTNEDVEECEKQIKLLQQELTKYKERCETLLDIIRYYKTTEWGLKSCEILDNFEEILQDKEKEDD